MLSVSHAATGAALALAIPSFPLALLLILCSHYLEDYIVHWDAGTGMGSGHKSALSALIHELLDLLATALVVLYLYPLPHFPPTSILEFLRQPQIWGACLALVPDLLEAPRNFLHYEPRWLQPLNRFHNAFHRSTPHVLAGLAPQVLLLIVLYILR